MKTKEQDSYSVTLQRVLKVFQGTTLAPQQETSFGRLIDKAMARNNPNPVPEAEIEGIKELVTEHLWHPALTQQLNSSKGSTSPSSAISASRPMSSGKARPKLCDGNF